MRYNQTTFDTRRCPRATTRLRVPRGQQGGTAVGFLVGVVAGLAIASGVAIVVTRAPMPFVNKSDVVNAKDITPRQGQLPDPNLGLRQAPAPAAPESTGQAPQEQAAAAPAKYLLQAGAYRSEVDAQSMRARLALIGYEAQIRAARVNNETLYRVRLGPFAALDQINTARAELANNGIEASVVRQ